MASLYGPVYTPDQARRVREGRAALLARWNAPPFKVPPPAMAANFAVENGGDDDVERTDAGDFIDVYTAKAAPERFPDVWAAETARPGFDLTHTRRGFHVYVPHSHYLRARWCCMSVDCACAANTLVYLLAIATIVRLALMLLGA